MNEKPYEVKNTQPAVMTDKGPYDTPRNKSKDGRYTADKQRGYNLEQQAPETDPEHQLKQHDVTDTEEEINARVYEPLFVQVVEKVFMPMMKMVNSKDPNRVPFLMKTNEWYDKKLGIDFVFGTKNSEGKANLGYVQTDLKVVDTFGKNNEAYANPSVPINLYKFYPKNNIWEDNSALNKKHINNFYTFLFPKSSRTKEQIKEYINFDPNIEEVKMIHVPKETLDTFVNDKILGNKEIAALIDAFKKGDMKTIVNHPRVTRPATGEPGIFIIPVPAMNEKFDISLFLNTREDGYKEIRAFIPNSKFKMRTISLKKEVNPFDKR